MSFNTHLRAAAGRVADELSLAAHLDVGGVRRSLEIFPQRWNKTNKVYVAFMDLSETFFPTDNRQRQC